MNLPTLVQIWRNLGIGQIMQNLIGAFTAHRMIDMRIHPIGPVSFAIDLFALSFQEPGTPQPLYNTIVGVHSINHVS